MTIDEDFEGSVLGTQEYWDAVYEREVKNFDEFGDVGEIWFGKHVENGMLTWINANERKEASIIELGCGNGHLMVQLAHKGFSNLVGVDYSERSIELAQKIAQDRQVKVEFKRLDILNEEDCGLKADLLVDKGTFDAISLCPSDQDIHERNAEATTKYAASAAKFLGKDGHLIISSCNWVLSELEQHFQNDFNLVCQVPIKQASFSFGGVTGQPTVCAVFRRK